MCTASCSATIFLHIIDVPHCRVTIGGLSDQPERVQHGTVGLADRPKGEDRQENIGGIREHELHLYLLLLMLMLLLVFIAEAQALLKCL